MKPNCGTGIDHWSVTANHRRSYAWRIAGRWKVRAGTGEKTDSLIKDSPVDGAGLEAPKRPRTGLLRIIIPTSPDEGPDAIPSRSPGTNSRICKPADFDRFGDAARQFGLQRLIFNKPSPREE